MLVTFSGVEFYRTVRYLSFKNELGNSCLVLPHLPKPMAFLSLSLTGRRRRRLRKRHLKSEFALPRALSRLFHLVQFVKCWQFCWS